MKNNEKIEFLKFAQKLAYNLEQKTNKFIEVKIGTMNTDFGRLVVTVMLNHNEKWFGDFGDIGWNTDVLLNNIKNFNPVQEDYLILNKLIEKAHGED